MSYFTAPFRFIFNSLVRELHQERLSKKLLSSVFELYIEEVGDLKAYAFVKNWIEIDQLPLHREKAGGFGER